MKIGVLQDVHANLPALKKAIDVFKEHQCDKIFHVGDLIGIGPFPKECLELALSIKKMNFVMGNHDYWYAFGIPKPRPIQMSAEEEKHQIWTHEQIGVTQKGKVQEWKFIEHLKLSNDRIVTFQHYGLDTEARWFKSYIANPDKSDLEKLFDAKSASFIFYGHNHEPSDISGKCRYVNLGSAGCHDRSEVRLGILEVTEDHLELNKLSVNYDDNGLLDTFEKKNVPARKFILKHFIKRA